LEIREKSLGPAHRDVAASLNNLAALYEDQGRYTEAEPLAKQSLEISEKALGPNHPDVAISLNNLAELYQHQGRNTDVEPLYKRSLEISEKALGSNHPDVAVSLNNLAEVYRKQGRNGEAERLYKQALAISEAAVGDHPNLALYLNNLALLYKTLGRYGEAEPLFKRSMGIREKALGPDHPKFAESLNNLASLYQAEGRYADAEPLYERGLAIDEKAMGLSHPTVAIFLNNLADLYRLQGRYADALPLVRRITEDSVEQRGIYLPILLGASANSLISRTDAISESYLLIQRVTSSAASNAINQLSVRFAAGNDQLAQLVRKDQDLGAEIQGLDNGLIASITKESRKRDASTEQKIRDRVQAISVERTRIESELSQKFPAFVALSKPAPLAVQETQALLADDEALILLDFDWQSYAWVITRSSADWFQLKITAKDLEAQIKALRSSITDTLDAPFDVDASYRLYQSIFGQIADRLKSKKRLSVVTNGALTSLPLQLLITKDPAGKKLRDVDWFVRSYATTILPSAASLKTLREHTGIDPATKPMIAFADPVFSKSARRAARERIAMRGMTSFATGAQIDVPLLAETLEQLPSTRDEVQTIAKLLDVDARDIKLGLDATVTAVKGANLDQYRIVYFATHGLVAGDVEKFAKGRVEPALALSIPDKPTDIDNGLLSASEIAQLKLNAEWVVLSACNTAAEDKPGAEALSGLARAFFYAGARSLIVSHWEVDDEVTAKLMTRTFLLIRDNPALSHGEALQQAMLSIIDNPSSEEEKNPRFWAPFVIVGEPEKPKW
jgi:CHAT domain-containing protein/tetratricopeptide (TPR) repeat protein